MKLCMKCGRTVKGIASCLDCLDFPTTLYHRKYEKGSRPYTGEYEMHQGQMKFVLRAWIRAGMIGHRWHLKVYTCFLTALADGWEK